MSNVVINTPADSYTIEVSATAEQQAGVGSNPTGRKSVLRLKLLAAAFLSECAKAPASSQPAPGPAPSPFPSDPAIPVNPATGRTWEAPYPTNPLTGREWTAYEVDLSTGRPYPFPAATVPAPAPYPGQPGQPGNAVQSMLAALAAAVACAEAAPSDY